MNIQTIKVFNHLAETLHFGKTSRAFNMTPSTLTRLVQRLEEEVGKKLFIRNNRSVMLTTAGLLFREYAEEVEQRWYLLQNRLAEDREVKGTVSLYCSVTAAHGILPDIVSTFRRDYPGVRLLLQTGDAAMALAKLQNQEADLTIAALPEKLPPMIESIQVTRTPLVFVAPQKHPDLPVYANGTVDWEATPIIMAEQGLSRIRLDRWFREHHIKPNIYAQVAGNEALLAMVSLGCGVGVVPELVLEKSLIRHEVKVLERAPLLTPFTIGLCTVKSRMDNPVIQAFWTTVLKVAASA